MIMLDKMKNINMKNKTWSSMMYSVALVFVMLSFSSCQDWLTEEAPGTTQLSDFFTSGDAAIQAVTAAYVPMMWEYNTTYFSEWFMGDVMSDDALKGGQNIGDMADVYDLENWKTNTNNTLVLDYFRAQYQGVARCNLALEYIPEMSTDSTMDESLRSRLLGEAHFLRAMYYFRLVRLFGGVPKIENVVYSSADWNQSRASSDEIYAFIKEDLEKANQELWVKSAYSDEDLGRATKGAAQAMLLKVNLYTKDYEAAEAWGDSIMASQEYSLCPNYKDNFTLAGENGQESVFEIQYSEDPTSDYGEGDGFTRGTFTLVLTRSRALDGWGFNKPTQNLYDAYETDDPRRDITILKPSSFVNESEEIYLGDPYLSRKYAMYDEYPEKTNLHASRGPLNYKVIRYADVLLMYAEACCENNALDKAKNALNEVRDRARGSLATTVLPDFPYGSYSLNQADLRTAIRHERRVELAMEGHRWFDLCRWGVAKETMDAYAATESDEAKAQMSTFIKGKHELLPIPSKEIELDPMMDQNPGY